MARYAISSEGANALNALANNLLINANNIVEASSELKKEVATLSGSLGVFEEEILSIVSRNAATLEQNKESIISLANSVKAKADEVTQLCSLEPDNKKTGFFHNIANRLRGTTATNTPLEKTMFCNRFAVEKAPLRPDRCFVAGNNSSAYIDYWVHMSSDYKEETCESTAIVYVNAKEIEGIYLSDNELANGDRFWTYKKDDGTLESFQRIAVDIPKVKALIDSGMTGTEILLNYPELEDCYSIYFEGSPCVGQADGFYVFGSGGRHRTLAAQSIDGIIPVRITSKISRKS